MTVAALAEAMNKDFGMKVGGRAAAVIDVQLNKIVLLRFRSCVGGAAQHLGGPGFSGAGLSPGRAVDQRGGEAVRDEVQVGQTEQEQRETQQRCSAEVRGRI